MTNSYFSWDGNVLVFHAEPQQALDRISPLAGVSCRDVPSADVPVAAWGELRGMVMPAKMPDGAYVGSYVCVSDYDPEWAAWKFAKAIDQPCRTSWFDLKKEKWSISVMRTPEQIRGWILYQLNYWPGCSLFVESECVYPGELSIRQQECVGRALDVVRHLDESYEPGGGDDALMDKFLAKMKAAKLDVLRHAYQE
jgi:hypothetical protein